MTASEMELKKKSPLTLLLLRDRPVKHIACLALANLALLSGSQVGKVLDMKIGTVKSNLNRALIAFRISVRESSSPAVETYTERLKAIKIAYDEKIRSTLIFFSDKIDPANTENIKLLSNTLLKLLEVDPGKELSQELQDFLTRLLAERKGPKNQRESEDTSI